MGLMSGTSQDGVDVALIETDGDIITRFGGTAYRSYSTPERALIRSATAVALNITERMARPEIVAAAEAAVNDAHVEAVATFLAANSVRPRDVAVIGFHGQTVLHRPERRLTIQIGDGRVLAARLGIPVVYDFRAADVAAGGEGAPFSPMYHRALARRLCLEPPVAVLNIGGLANVTYIDGDDLIACDTGPGNALLDDFVRLRIAKPLDTDGHIAQAGRVDREAIARLLKHPFFAKPPPKSLDRNEFRGWVGYCIRQRQRGRRGRYLDRAHRDSGRAHRAASAAGAENLDRVGWQRTQSDADAHARRASRAGPRADRG